MENNIGKLNAIFTQNVTGLLKRNNSPKLIKEYVNIITKDKVLLKEFILFDYIENIKDSKDIKEHITEAISCLNDIEQSKLIESNNKIINFMINNDIKQINEIKNEKLYEAINSVIFRKKSLKNINENVSKINNLVDIISEKCKLNESLEENYPKVNDIDTFLAISINNFNKKYLNKLTEDEKKIFKQITSKIDENEQKIIFEDNRNECLKLTNNFLNEEIDIVTKEKLLNVKEKLLEQKYDKNTYIKDMISFNELKQTLS